MVLAAFFLIISVTGFLLAMKATVDWIRPPEVTGAQLISSKEIASLDDVLQAAFALNIPELRSTKDVDRVDYRPKSNIFKVISKEGYHEVQVDGKTAKVLSVSRRNDQWIEDMHDLSFFGDALRSYGLPAIAIGLFGLAGSGLAMFLTPVLRRRRYRRQSRGPSRANVDK